MEELQIGDIVEFINTIKYGNNENLNNWYTERHGIPEELLITHGATIELGETYKKEKAKITNKYKNEYDEFYIVEYKDVRNTTVRLGFKKNQIKKVKNIGKWGNQKLRNILQEKKII